VNAVSWVVGRECVYGGGGGGGEVMMMDAVDLAGNVGREVFKGQDIASIHHKLHLHADRFLAARWIGIHRRGRRLGAGAERWRRRGRRVGRRCDRVLAHRLLHLALVVEDADGAVLTDPVRHFHGVDPHRQFGWEERVQELARQTDQIASLDQHGIYFAVDADAAVARSFARLLREPVLLVAYPQRFNQGRSVDLQLLVGNDCRFFVESQQSHQKIGR